MTQKEKIIWYRITFISGCDVTFDGWTEESAVRADAFQWRRAFVAGIASSATMGRNNLKNHCYFFFNLIYKFQIKRNEATTYIFGLKEKVIWRRRFGQLN